MSSSLFNLALQTIDGEPTSLEFYRGKVLLIVNVASKCGLTKQYEGLEALYQQYKDQGLVVLGFPANDFKGQEPGSNEEIKNFCSTEYNVSFPLFAKMVVTGEHKHPLYQRLIEHAPVTRGRESMAERLQGHGITPTEAPEVVWNFEKFLIAKNGDVVGRFAPNTTPEDSHLTAAIQTALDA
ncbi:glutathione peroxidase [Pokkaliibacter sp. CJK22405]|uniref:glutathione peroxidase n=1 Tax=Pokkaliibacter sp. CJK22405 TaxID=3384615 RepID=UPI0039853701